ncbi:hypothetical protein D3C80_1841000 [compost metagenome]
MRMGKVDDNLFWIAIIIELMDEMACRTEEQLPGDRIRCRICGCVNSQVNRCYFPGKRQRAEQNPEQNSNRQIICSDHCNHRYNHD